MDYLISELEFLLKGDHRDRIHPLGVSQGSWDTQKGLRDVWKDDLRVRFDLGTR